MYTEPSRGRSLNPSPPSRAVLEEAWRKRAGAARRRYLDQRDRANELLQERVQNFAKFGPDGVYAIRQARLHESAALVEYVRVLRIYTDLAVYGITPDED